ncbi:unnamed protein product [Oikopleura dioica]|uniref:Uncharacterized protein n=1 Tax=Oikopleura dioica TaxID=34765 RepID=E4XAB7_OIKDI|nr:unnamed protein product [Oikopleura dioica]
MNILQFLKRTLVRILHRSCQNIELNWTVRFCQAFRLRNLGEDVAIRKLLFLTQLQVNSHFPSEITKKFQMVLANFSIKSACDFQNSMNSTESTNRSLLASSLEKSQKSLQKTKIMQTTGLTAQFQKEKKLFPEKLGRLGRTLIFTPGPGRGRAGHFSIPDLEHDIQDNISSNTTEPEVVSDQSETLSEKLPARIASKSVCPDFAENFRKSSSAPKYNLNENRLISHFVSNGPNNQIVDFRHGLYWAIKLNITTTLPLFYEHFTVSKTNSRSNSSSILPKHRIKLDSALLSSISPEEFGRRCSNQEIAFLDATPGEFPFSVRNNKNNFRFC